MTIIATVFDRSEAVTVDGTACFVYSSSDRATLYFDGETAIQPGSLIKKDSGDWRIESVTINPFKGLIEVKAFPSIIGLPTTKELTPTATTN